MRESERQCQAQSTHGADEEEGLSRGCRHFINVQDQPVLPHHPPAEPPGWLLIRVVCRSDRSGNVDGGTKEGSVASMCRVHLAGRIPASRVELIRSRFGDMSLRAIAGGTVLKGLSLINPQFAPC